MPRSRAQCTTSRSPRDVLPSEQERGELRHDQPAERVAGFISLAANGIAVQVALGEPIRDVDALIEFVRAAVEP